MKILGFECTAAPVSAALLDGEDLRAEYYMRLNATHSQTLLPMADSLLKLNGIAVSDIDYIAVAAGPGSFTGVRIGISAVKGLAFADDIPCVPVSVLEAMAYNFLDDDCTVCAVMDARCNQFYNAMFSVSNGTVTRLCDDRALMNDELCDDLIANYSASGKKTVIVGDGANLFYNSNKERISSIELAPENMRWQRASGVCLAALKAVNDGKTVTPAELLPIYLRLPQAERELLAKKGKM